MLIVSSLSKMHECGSPWMSLDTIGSSVYRRIPFSGPDLAALAKAALISSTDASRARGWR